MVVEGLEFAQVAQEVMLVSDQRALEELTPAGQYPSSATPDLNPVCEGSAERLTGRVPIQPGVALTLTVAPASPATRKRRGGLTRA